ECLQPVSQAEVLMRSCGREAEGGGLLNRYRVVKPYRGFESLRLRHPAAQSAGGKITHHHGMRSGMGGRDRLSPSGSTNRGQAIWARAQRAIRAPARTKNRPKPV